MALIDQPRRASAWASTSSPCVSMGRGSFAAAGVEHQQHRVGPRPVGGPSGRPVPVAQTWGDSVISCGEFPLIGDSVSEDRLPVRSDADSVTCGTTIGRSARSSRKRRRIPDIASVGRQDSSSGSPAGNPLRLSLCVA